MVVLLVGLFLRVHNIGAESAWNDEYLSLQCLDEPSLGAYLACCTELDPTIGPVYYAVQYGWSRVVGTSVLEVRALSLVLGMGSIVALYFLGSVMFSRRAGLVAAVYASLSVLHVYYSQEIRTYPLVLLLASLSMYFFVRGLQTQRAAPWIGHTIVNGVLAGTHVIGAFMLVPQGLYLLIFRRDRLKYFGYWFVAQMAALSPMIVLMAVRYEAARGMLYHIHQVSFWDFIHTFLINMGGRYRNLNPAPNLPGGVSLEGVFALFVIAMAGVLFYTAWRNRDVGPAGAEDDRFRYACLLALWLVVPPAMLFVLSHAWRPCYQPRYVLHCSLAIFLMVGGGIGTFSSANLARGATAVLVVLLGYQALVLRSGPLRIDFASAARYIEEHAERGDHVVAFKSFTGVAMGFHTDFPEGQFHWTPSFGDMVELTEEACADGCGAWVVMYQWGHPEWFMDRLEQSNLEAETHRFGREPPLIVYHVTRRD